MSLVCSTARTVTRCAWRKPGAGNYCPADAALSLPAGRHSHSLAKLAAIEAAKRAHDESWSEGIKRRTGGDPSSRYFDLFLLIDNEHQRVVEWADDGTAHELEGV